MIDAAEITGLVLAGGRGTRMEGADKGLQLLHGQPLAQRALDRLRPQVGSIAVSANRNLDAYRSMGADVWPDTLPDFPGPLAGFLTGLERCVTPYLVSVPCDTPQFPLDLVARLAEALDREGAEVAVAANSSGDEPKLHPVFCLMRVELADDLRSFIERGQRKVGKWTAMHRLAIVTFDETAAFANANTTADLALLRGPA